MAEYHVGCGIFGIYAGTITEDKRRWVRKSEVTDEALSAAAQYLLQEKKCLVFDYHGEKYRLSVTKLEAAGENGTEE